MGLAQASLKALLPHGAAAADRLGLGDVVGVAFGLGKEQGRLTLARCVGRPGLSGRDEGTGLSLPELMFAPLGAFGTAFIGLVRSSPMGRFPITSYKFIEQINMKYQAVIGLVRCRLV